MLKLIIAGLIGAIIPVVTGIAILSEWKGTVDTGLSAINDRLAGLNIEIREVDSQNTALNEWKGGVDSQLGQIESRAKRAALEAIEDETVKSERARLFREAEENARDAARRHGQAEENAKKKAQSYEQEVTAAIRAADELLEKVEDLKRDIDLTSIKESLSETIRNPEFQKAVVQRVKIPSGAILAFDLTAGCPKGSEWSPYDLAGGRVILGAAKHTNLDQNGEKLSQYELGESGGEEKHKLEKDELPSHAHATEHQLMQVAGQSSSNRIALMQDGASARGLITASNKAGGNVPHNNMPPYISLYFCKKA